MPQTGSMAMASLKRGRADQAGQRGDVQGVQVLLVGGLELGAEQASQWQAVGPRLGGEQAQVLGGQAHLEAALGVVLLGHPPPVDVVSRAIEVGAVEEA